MREFKNISLEMALEKTRYKKLMTLAKKDHRFKDLKIEKLYSESNKS